MTLTAVGQKWQGLSMKDFPLVVAQPNPPKVKPSFVNVNGNEYLELVLSKGEHRVQPQTGGLLAMGHRYSALLTTFMNKGDIIVPPKYWFALWQIFGGPFTGSPDVQLQMDSNGMIGPREANGVWLSRIPITWGTDMVWEFDFAQVRSGQFAVKCNGKQIYSSPNYAVVTSADAQGPWSYEPHLYTALQGLPTDSKCLYRNMSVECVG